MDRIGLALLLFSLISTLILAMTADVSASGTGAPFADACDAPVSNGPAGSVPRLPRLDELPPAALDSLLADLHRRLPDFSARLRALALARVGVPYVLGSLGEETPADPDPVFRLDEADCTVLVLTTAALAHAKSAAEARAWMRPANYRRQGDDFPLRYDNRLHFTSDRLTASPLFEDLTARIAPPASRRRIQLTLNQRTDGTRLLPIPWQRTIELDYVPSAELAALLDQLPPVAGIAFVREHWRGRGVLVAHEGLLLDGRCLLHASSVAGEVVMVDLMNYLWRRDETDAGLRDTQRFDGAILYGFRDATGEIPQPPAATSGR